MIILCKDSELWCGLQVFWREFCEKMGVGYKGGSRAELDLG